MGEFILLVDSDTRIPSDCILPTVSELLQSPSVGFTQHLITPMQVCCSFCALHRNMKLRSFEVHKGTSPSGGPASNMVLMCFAGHGFAAFQCLDS